MGWWLVQPVVNRLWAVIPPRKSSTQHVALDLFGSREGGGTSFGPDIRVSVVEWIHKARSPAPLGAG